jgi:DNA-binding response OmpR family regulator
LLCGKSNPQFALRAWAQEETGVLELLASVLERNGYRVLSAPDGLTAFAVVTRAHEAGSPVTLLVTDVVMPGLNGFALAAGAQAVSPGLEVIFISGQRDRVPPQGSALLNKPFSPEELLGLVRAREAAAGRR